MVDETKKMKVGDVFIGHLLKPSKKIRHLLKGVIDMGKYINLNREEINKRVEEL